MIIINRTNQVQELRVYDFATKRYYSIYVGANSKAEIHHSLSTPDLKRLIEAGVFCVLGESPVKYNREESPVEENLESDTEDKEDEEESLGEGNEESPVEEDSLPDSDDVSKETKFICEICGGEYASARGLSNHMNKAHKE